LPTTSVLDMTSLQQLCWY